VKKGILILKKNRKTTNGYINDTIIAMTKYLIGTYLFSLDQTASIYLWSKISYAEIIMMLQQNHFFPCFKAGLNFGIDKVVHVFLVKLTSSCPSNASKIILYSFIFI